MEATDGKSFEPAEGCSTAAETELEAAEAEPEAAEAEPEAGARLDTLPPEVVTCILRFLRHRDLYHVARVSRAFAGLAHDFCRARLRRLHKTDLVGCTDADHGDGQRRRCVCVDTLAGRFPWARSYAVGCAQTGACRYVESERSVAVGERHIFVYDDTLLRVAAFDRRTLRLTKVLLTFSDSWFVQLRLTAADSLLVTLQTNGPLECSLSDIKAISVCNVSTLEHVGDITDLEEQAKVVDPECGESVRLTHFLANSFLLALGLRHEARKDVWVLLYRLSSSGLLPQALACHSLVPPPAGLPAGLTLGMFIALNDAYMVRPCLTAGHNVENFVLYDMSRPRAGRYVPPHTLVSFGGGKEGVRLDTPQFVLSPGPSSCLFLLDKDSERTFYAVSLPCIRPAAVLPDTTDLQLTLHRYDGTEDAAEMYFDGPDGKVFALAWTEGREAKTLRLFYMEPMESGEWRPSMSALVDRHPPQVGEELICLDRHGLVVMTDHGFHQELRSYEFVLNR